MVQLIIILYYMMDCDITLIANSIIKNSGIYY